MRQWYVTGFAVLLAACGREVSGERVVHPGQSIQAAVDAAPPNSTIFVEPGIYRESPGSPIAVTITKDGIHLVGRSSADAPVVLEPASGQRDGFWVSPADSVDAPDDEHPVCGQNGHTVRDFTLEGFTVGAFERFGVYLACNDGYNLSGNISDGAGVYGLFPVRSKNGRVVGNEAKNTPRDAAIYVGQSENIVIQNNVAHDSLIGIEVENTSHAQVLHNQSFHNTIGIILDVLPDLQKKDQVDVVVDDNDTHENNRENTADPGDLTASIPPGIGILLVTGSEQIVRNNRSYNNDFAGIAAAGYCTAAQLAGNPCTGLDIDVDLTNNQIINNQLGGNGHNPPNNLVLKAIAGDLVWDNNGTGNCWSGNTPLPPATTIKSTSISGAPLPTCAAPQ